MRTRPSPRRLFFPAFFIFALFAAQLFVDRGPTQWPLRGRVMGTTWSLRVVAPKPPAQEEAQRVLDAVNARMSTYLPDSELSRLNRAVEETHTLSLPLAEVLRSALAIFEASEGAFDVTVGPLVRAWGFGPEQLAAGAKPSEEELRALLARVGSQRLTLNGESLTRRGEGIDIDLSAIAKGYAVDQLALWLEEQGYQRYLVEVGGELRVRGLNGDGEPWRLGVEAPLIGARGLHQIIGLRAGALATSGDYRNFRLVDGRRVSHTIDPRTGAPIDHPVASVSVIAADAMSADAWATALNVLGAERGLPIAEQAGVGVLFLLRDEEGNISERANERFRRYVEAQSCPARASNGANEEEPGGAAGE